MRKDINELTEKTIKNLVENNKNTEKWSKWSLTPHTEDEIRKECLTNFDHVCFTYVCETSELSPEFIEELMVLSTGIMGQYYLKIEQANDKKERDKAQAEYDKIFKKIQDTILYNIKVCSIKPEKFNITYEEVIDRECNGTIKTSVKSISSNNIVDRLDWYSISKFQTIPEWFIQKYEPIINWKEVFNSQKLSDDFIKKYKHKISEK